MTHLVLYAHEQEKMRSGIKVKSKERRKKGGAKNSELMEQAHVACQGKPPGRESWW